MAYTHIPQAADVAGTMAEVSISMQIDRYLQRLRQSVPFPCTKEETYFGLMPDVVKEWHQKGLLTPDGLPAPGKVYNLLSTMHSKPDFRTLSTTHEANNIIHISADTMDAFSRSLHGADPLMKVFWFEPPDWVPLPRNPHSAIFFLPLEHPSREVLIRWIATADAMETNIQTALSVVRAFESLVSGPKAAHELWPELTNFLKWKRQVSVPRSSHHALKHKFNKRVTEGEKELVTNLLATAVMLPEQGPRLVAWVGYYSGTDYNRYVK